MKTATPLGSLAAIIIILAGTCPVYPGELGKSENEEIIDSTIVSIGNESYLLTIVKSIFKYNFISGNSSSILDKKLIEVHKYPIRRDGKVNHDNKTTIWRKLEPAYNIHTDVAGNIPDTSIYTSKNSKDIYIAFSTGLLFYYRKIKIDNKAQKMPETTVDTSKISSSNPSDKTRIFPPAEMIHKLINAMGGFSNISIFVSDDKIFFTLYGRNVSSMIACDKNGKNWETIFIPKALGDSEK